MSQEPGPCNPGTEVAPYGRKEILLSPFFPLRAPSGSPYCCYLSRHCRPCPQRCELYPPRAVTTKVNDRGSVTLLITDPATRAAAFAPYFDALSCKLNKSLPVGDSPWLPFRLAPSESQLAIHSLPLALLPEDPEELFPCLAESILNSKNIRILAARYLNPDTGSREGKTATSVIVSVHPGDVLTMGASIGLFSRSRTIERAYSSNRYTQCKICWR